MIDYDYYIRLETGDSDQRMFLEEYLHSKQVALFAGNKVRFNNVGKTSEERVAENGYTQLEAAFADVNRTDFDTIYKHYRVDSLLFGYKQSLSEDGLTSSCRASAEHDEQQCCWNDLVGQKQSTRLWARQDEKEYVELRTTYVNSTIFVLISAKNMYF